MRGLDHWIEREPYDADDYRDDVCPDCGWRECLCREEMTTNGEATTEPRTADQRPQHRGGLRADSRPAGHALPPHSLTRR